MARLCCTRDHGCTSFCQAIELRPAAEVTNQSATSRGRDDAASCTCSRHHLNISLSPVLPSCSPSSLLSMAFVLRPVLLRHAARHPLVRPAILPAVSRWARPAPLAPQAAAFQTSAQRNILPPLPQRVQGTVNDAAHVPTPDPMHGSYHWSFERCAESINI